MRDALTGLYNRSGYFSKAERYFQEKAGKVYLIYLDLDNLKMINDQYGHGEGDKAILALSEALMNVFSEDEIHVRMGGDEFLVIGSFRSEADILEKEKQVEEYLEEYSYREEFPVILRSSMGHAWNEGGNVTLEALVQHADTEMYQVKLRRRAEQ